MIYDFPYPVIANKFEISNRNINTPDVTYCEYNIAKSEIPYDEDTMENRVLEGAFNVKMNGVFKSIILIHRGLAIPPSFGNVDKNLTIKSNNNKTDQNQDHMIQVDIHILDPQMQ